MGALERLASAHWLERTVRDLFQSVVNEPVPQGLLDIVEQFPHARPSITEAFERARRWRNKAG